MNNPELDQQSNINNQQNNVNNQQNNINNQQNANYSNQQKVSETSNTVGTVGFVLSLVSIFIGWVPFFGWLLWIAGLVCSAIGISKEPKKLAIAGLIISFACLLIILLIYIIGYIGRNYDY